MRVYRDTSLIADAIAGIRERAASHAAQHHTELATIGREIGRITQALQRYQTAFETGELSAKRFNQRSPSWTPNAAASANTSGRSAPSWTPPT